MEFGRVDSLDNIDFTLPPDDEGTTRLLKNLQSTQTKPQVFVGCAKWGRKDWIGKVYPPKTKEADFLKLYAQNFNCIELNATFYKIPSHRQAASWSIQVGENFRFFPKFTGIISHNKRLKGVKELTDSFLEGVSGFGKNLGPVFLMPNPQLGPKSLDTIESFIQELPHDIKLFVELRHDEFYSNRNAFKTAFDMFEQHKTGSIITDASGRRDCVHMRLTTPEGFIRFVGNGLHPTDYTRVDDWVNRIKSWLEQGLEKVYFFMHQHEEIHSPELCKYVIQQLNKECGLDIKEPNFLSDPPNLFS